MIPTFSQIQWIARDREDEIRKEVAQGHNHGGSARPQPGVQDRAINVWRSLVNRRDPQPSC